VPVEPDFSPEYSEPDLPLYTQWNSWSNQALASVGSALPSMGRRLWAIAEEAGLRPLGMIGVQPHFGPVDEVALAVSVESLRNIMPLIVGAGVATADEIGMETWAQRLRDEWEKTRSVVGGPTWVSAWATTGPE
jgi:hypothetical protein